MNKKLEIWHYEIYDTDLLQKTLRFILIQLTLNNLRWPNLFILIEDISIYFQI
jgi:hypothetical protein